MLTLIALSAVLMQDPPAPPAPRETFTRVMVVGPDGPGSLDKDGDGQVSREEFAAPMNDHFARIDVDGDGRLSTGELSAGHGPSGDGNVMVFHGGDGGPGAHRFEMRHHDGGEAGMREEHEIVVRTPGGPGGPVVIHGPVHGASGGESRFEIRQMGGPGGAADMDKDGDGKISEAEFTAPLREAFARMDADRSGFIEEGEKGSGRDIQVFTRRLDRPGGGED